MSTEVSDWSAGKKPSQRIIKNHCRNLNLCKDVLLGTTVEITKSARETSPISGMLQFSGFAIDRTKKTLVESICEEANGFMRWPKNTIQRLSKDGSIRGNEMVNAKLELVAYLYELGYDLCISQQDNVSQSPGFEKYLGQFGRGREE